MLDAHPANTRAQVTDASRNRIVVCIEHLRSVVGAGAPDFRIPAGPCKRQYGAREQDDVVARRDLAARRQGPRCAAGLGVFVDTGEGNLSGPRTLAFKTHITMCHRPPGNPAKARMLRVAYLDGLDHAAHGDEVGACS